MKSLRNESGAVFVFVTLMIVLLLIMVGLGLDTGWLSYNRAQGQPAVDMAALTGATGIPTGSTAEIKTRIEELNSTNDYVKSQSNPIDGQVNGANVTLVKYDPATGNITKVSTLADAHGVRVALEQKNPYTNNASGTAINTPTFLTPLINLLGGNAPATADVSVSAVAVIRGLTAMPITIGGCPPAPGLCTGPTIPNADGTKTYQECTLLQTPSPDDNSAWTTFYDKSASASDIKTLIKAGRKCDGTIPFLIPNKSCIEVNNGQIQTVLAEIKNEYSPFSGKTKTPNSDDCFLIPVVDPNIQFIQCQIVRTFATLCIREVDTTGSPKYLYGDVTCPIDNYGAQATKCYKPTLVRDAKSGM